MYLNPYWKMKNQFDFFFQEPENKNQAMGLDCFSPPAGIKSLSSSVFVKTILYSRTLSFL